MRIHVIRAENLQAALQIVRDQHGDDAIVLDTVEAPDEVTVRVGVQAEPQRPPEPAAPEPALTSKSTTDRVAEALAWHGAPPLVTRSLLLAIESDDATDAETALANALERTFRFGRPENLATPLALVGPPGAGKTATLAKLAAARSMAGAAVAIINADLETSGAKARVDAFAAALDVRPAEAAGGAAISGAIQDAGPDKVTLLDTSGRAPADAADIEAVAEEIEAAGAGALVLQATLAPVEAAELAECFAAAGATELIMTQLDIARRVGALLAAADAGDLKIAAVSLGRRVGDGLRPLTGESLAKLILAPPQPIVKPARAKPRAAPLNANATYAANGAAA